MNGRAAHTGFRKCIGWLAAGILGLHLAACLFFAVGSWSKQFQNSLPGTFYHSQVLAGPFFREEALPYTTHFYYRYKAKHDAWTAFTDLSQSQFAAYNQQPWRYGRFTRTVYLNRVANDLDRHVRRRINWSRAPEPLKQINHYIVYNTGIADIDSVSLIAVRCEYDIVENGRQRDTLYRFTYSPSQLEKPY